MLYHLFDMMIAETLGVTVQEYINKIEGTDEGTMTRIIELAMFNDNPEEAKKEFEKL